MFINSKSGSIVAGNATKDPEYKLIGDKKTPLFKLSIAIGKDEQGGTMYADIAAWRKLAELLNGYGIKKGDPVAAFGTWSKKDSDNGKVYWTFNADYVSVLGKMSVGSPSDSAGTETDEPPYDFGEMPDFMK
jgi:single-stranded DNA-binding protein